MGVLLLDPASGLGVHEENVHITAMPEISPMSVLGLEQRIHLGGSLLVLVSLLQRTAIDILVAFLAYGHVDLQ